jgi:AcrR family transcriptional regulator
MTDSSPAHRSSRGGRTGRRPGDAGTRERIASAARVAFGELGFEGATIREIAGRAGVDPALVHHYFGSKQTLFLAVMQLPFDVGLLRATVVSGEGPSPGHRLIRFFVTMLDEQAAFRGFVTGIVRSASRDRAAGALLRDFLGRQGLFQLVAEVAVDRPDLRATLVGSQFVGLVMARYVVGLEPLASLPREAVVAALGPTIERYLTGDIGPETVTSSSTG